MFCREQAARIGARQADIEALGATLVAIGNGTELMARDFAQQFDVQFELLTDPARESYRAAGLRKQNFLRLEGIGASLGHGWKTWRAGFRQGKTQGDPFQNGGLLVVDTDGTILLEHTEQAAGDLVPVSRVIDVLQGRARRVAARS
jgi:hypothetical protein